MEKFRTKYGYFSEDGREYVILRPDTPRPWINLVFNREYGLVISQTGSGFSWWGDANICRLTRWEQDLIKDEWGKYLYIRDLDSGDYWSAGWKPVCADYEDYECRHGIGYTIIKNTTHRITSAVTYFVPPDEPLEIWKVTLSNGSTKPRRLSLISYLEWCLGNAQDTHREFQKTFIETDYDPDSFAIFGRKRRQLVPGHISTGLMEWPCEAFHAVSARPGSFEGDKEAFIGMYRSQRNPMAVERGRLSGTVGKWHDSIAGLQVELELAPGEKKDVIFTLGLAKGRKEAKSLIKKYSSCKEVDEAFGGTRAFWARYLDDLSVETPDEAFNIMTNVWLKYQAIGRMWARTAYYQSSGGYGFRDQIQDSQVFLSLDAAETRRQILLHAEHQFVDGTVYHWWHPLIEVGARTGISDNLLWMVFVTLNYLKETGDFTILDARAKYVDGPEAPLYEHCLKAIERVLGRFSERGLPLIGEGDWNDGMNRVGTEGRGESIWLSHFLYGVLTGFSEVCSKRGDEVRTQEFRTRAEQLKAKVNDYGWDGRWYIRATRDDGEPLGSSNCREGKLFLNAQTWAVINGVASNERAEGVMDEVEKLLVREYGPLLFHPAYLEPDEKIGYLSRYSPGLRENGGLYSHAATWAVEAECILGKGDKAYDIYSRMCPIKRGKNPDHYKAEPYVTPGNVDGPDSAHFGRGGWTWYTGSAAWMFRIGVESMLGVRPTYEGLVIDPCIPKEWNGFKITRKFRGATYIIEVRNPDHVEKGVKEVVVDGAKLRSSVIAPFADGKTHKVEVVMGRRG